MNSEFHAEVPHMTTARENLFKTIERLGIYKERYSLEKALDELNKALSASIYGNYGSVVQVESIEEALKDVTFKGILGSINETK